MSSDDEITPIDAGARDVLAKLDKGYAKIESAKADGDNTAFLEQFWIDLLSEYDAVCRIVNGDDQGDSK